jgi:cell division protein FtsB
MAFRLKPRIRFPKIPVAPQLVIISLVILMIGAMAIEPTRQLIDQRRRISGMESELGRIERSNERLEKRIARLNDPDYLEAEARRQIGLVRPNETAVLVVPPSRAAQRKVEQAKAAAEPPPPPPEPTFVEGLLNFIGL